MSTEKGTAKLRKGGGEPLRMYARWGINHWAERAQFEDDVESLRRQVQGLATLAHMILHEAERLQAGGDPNDDPTEAATWTDDGQLLLK